jgi:PPOX class probable F420-dependent enzyme
MSSSEFQRLSTEKYLVVTTFRRSGQGVPTPVWAGALDGDLVVWSNRKAGKVKRIRNNGHVEVQACDARGRKRYGAVVTGAARLLDPDDSDRARASIARKYGIFGRISMFFDRIRGGNARTVGIAITLDQ